MQPVHDGYDGYRDASAVGMSPILLWGIWLFWLGFLVYPLTAILHLRSAPLRAANLLGLALFVGLYLWITWHAAHRFSRATPLNAAERRWWVPVAFLIALSLVMTLVLGEAALGSFIYVSACVSGRLTARRIVLVIGGLWLLVVLLGTITASSLLAVGQALFIIPSVATIVYFFSHAIRTNQELRLARREIARLAVSEERLRFARDLHDLLGHTLSLITLKSELAGQLIAEEPEQAQREVREIEAAARTALQEVREAVAGYRQTTLASELQRAQELLAAAGIECSVRDEAGTVPVPIATLLAWVVREGVTNVIRHSRAQHCGVVLTQRAGEVCLSITDDGRGCGHEGDGQGWSEGVALAGNGLRGIRERVAAAGGRCEAGPADEQGFRLAVALLLRQSPERSVSVDQRARGRGATV